MSDSDSDGLITNNVFTFQNESTLVSAKGPNTNMSNITGLSFRNNVFSSTMQMSRNYERQRYAESNYDPRSRRDTSPMSIRSAGDMRPRNFNYSFNPQGMCAQRSNFNRGGSPMSVRSIDTTTSMSAVDIANALKNEHFNKYELKVIKEAYNRFVKHKVRKKMENRKYRKIHRRKSGYDSGEQGSNSSLSSDDRSVRTTSYRDNMSSCRSTITDISNFKKKIKQSGMFRDCTDYLKHNSIQSAGGLGSWNSAQSSISSHRSMPAGSNMPQFRNIPANFNRMQEKSTAPGMSLKDRFKSGYQLPSQRFNKSVIPSAIPENTEKELNQINSQNKGFNKNSKENNELDSEDDIFSTIPKEKEPSKVNRKRSVDSEDIFLPTEKRHKTLSPCKNSIDARKQKACDDKANDFIFAMPTGPARKSMKEKLISKSAVPLTDTIPQIVSPPRNNQPRHDKPAEEDKLEDESSNSTCNSSNLSMKPSFIKRKLFTQKLDVSEKRNVSMENMDSPQNSMYHDIQKEKHKARKLQQATTQSCLSREIQKDESNLLDLINKIVPIDQMNMTNQTNKTSQSKNLTEDDDKWDITSIMSTRKNDDDESDTYTDEEILNATVKELQRQDMLKQLAVKESAVKVKKNGQLPTKRSEDITKKNTAKKQSPNKAKSCKILLEKLPPNIKQTTIRQFWDTDFESDVECQPSPKIPKLNAKQIPKSDFLKPKEAPKKKGNSDIFSSKNTTTAPIPVSQNYTFDTTQKFNSTLRIKSHRAPKRNKLDQTTDGKGLTAILASENKQKACEDNKTKKISIADPKPRTKIESKKPRETAVKKDKKSPKAKTTKIDKHNQSIQKPTTKKQNTIIVEQTNNKKEDSKKQKQNTKTEEQTNNKKEVDSKKQKQKTKTSVSSEQMNKKEVDDKKLNSNSKKLDKENKTPPKKSHSDKKVTEPKLPRKSPNMRSTKKTTQKNMTLQTEENNNQPNRTVRSCRKNPKNQFANQSNVSLNNTTNRTLRSRKLDLSSASIKNDIKTVQRDIKSYMEKRLSDVSFSLTAEKNTLAKRAIAKSTNNRILIGDESDVSFSLTPTPRKTRSSNRKNTLNSTPLRKNPLHKKDLPLSNIRSSRLRTPNKRFLY